MHPVVRIAQELGLAYCKNSVLARNTETGAVSHNPAKQGRVK
jgi:hypothetical protein